MPGGVLLVGILFALLVPGDDPLVVDREQPEQVAQVLDDVGLAMAVGAVATECGPEVRGVTKRWLRGSP
ncbi:hypothetical protein [Streptomyces sp. NPDC005989]|uniref:hypothetical protein n=1 Tax=Streptomyces sp. NPDC005989 TaxID=3156727 RepID=UPI0033E7669C